MKSRAKRLYFDDVRLEAVTALFIAANANGRRWVAKAQQIAAKRFPELRNLNGCQIRYLVKQYKDKVDAGEIKADNAVDNGNGARPEGASTPLDDIWLTIARAQQVVMVVKDLDDESALAVLDAARWYILQQKGKKADGNGG